MQTGRGIADGRDSLRGRPGLETLAESGVEKGAQDFKVSPGNGRTLLWLEERTRGRKRALGEMPWEIRMKVYTVDLE